MAIFDSITNASDALKNIGKAELIPPLLELYDKYLALREENQSLRDEIKQYKEAEDIKNRLSFENNSYYLNEPNDHKAGPFCSGCWDASRKLIHMHSAETGTGELFFICPNCKRNVFQ